MIGGLDVDVTGKGPPLVLLHGWAMHSEMWGSLVPRLAQRFRVHAVDLPGHGRSAQLPEFTLDGMVAVLASTFASSTEPVVVVGWSLGGLVAMRWALAWPERVARIVLVATSPRFVAGEDWPHGMSAETLARFGDELRVAWKLTMERFLTLQLQGAPRSRATLSALRGRMFARGAPSPAALFGALALIRDTDLRGEIPGILQPALVVSGERDTLALPGAGRWLADHLRNATFAPIPGAAHIPFLSHADEFAAALDPFLDAR
jgi:pimeloyl-[acyl-carrier protein] methyl ester esterase